MKSYKLEELDNLALGFIEGEVDKRQIWSLPTLDMWCTLGFANIYSLNMLGVISPCTAVSFRLGIASAYSSLEGHFDYTDAQQKRIRKNEYAANELLNKIAKTINKAEKNGGEVTIDVLIELIELAFKAIGILTGQGNVYLTMFRGLINNSNFKSDMIAQLMKMDFEFDESIPPYTYTQLLMRFFTFCTDDGITARMASVDQDRINKLARKIPPKGYGETENLVKNIKNVYVRGKYGDGWS